jgi:uncharacterized membrane protein
MRALMQWLHLAGVVVAVGGTAFVRLILLPSFVAIDPQARQRVMAGVARAFYPTLWWAILAILVSGLFNLHVAFQAGIDPAYLAVLAGKILLALILFAVAFAVTLPWPALAEFQRRRPRWLAVNLGLAAVILLLSAILRRM